jgi:hypothetical protein
MTLNLVKGEFSSLEEALRAQVQKMEAELELMKTQTAIPHAETPLDHDAGTRADYWEHLYKEADAKRTLLQEKSEKLLLMVAKRDEKINDLEILVKGHRASIREYKHEVEKLEADKELNKGIIHGQSEVIDDLRSQLETPINFDPEDDE